MRGKGRQFVRGKRFGLVSSIALAACLASGGLASARGRIVAMVIPNISGPIFANTIQGFSDTLSRHGYQLLLASSYFSAEQEESAVRAFLDEALLHQAFHLGGIADAVPLAARVDAQGRPLVAGELALGAGDMHAVRGFQAPGRFQLLA